GSIIVYMKKIGTYVILTFLLSSAGYYLIIHSKALGLSPFIVMFYLMWCPGLSGIITSLIYEKNISGIGFKPGRPRWLALGYFLPIFYASLAYGIIWLSGFGGIDHAYRFNAVKIIFMGTLLNIAFAMGEETGWRGFLVPQLYKYTGNFTKTCFITGVIWSVWHFPLIISGVYLAKMPVGSQLILLVVTVTAMTFPISWLRLRSGSVWPAVLLHASHNLYIQRFFDPITTETGPMSKYMIGESGLVLMVVFIGLAFIFWRLRKILSPLA
ncbi:MAG: CPBP family intramembrane glutamic endopeptidase, partial [Candidatus Margulisiibacteriota bacterium]